MDLMGKITAVIDAAKRTAGKRVSDLVTDPAANWEMINDQAANYNANVQPTIQGGALDNRPLTPEEIDQKSTDLAMAVMPMGVGSMKLFHGGNIVKHPIADKQNVIVRGVPATSTSESLLEAARYGVANRGPINELSGDFKLYQKGADKELDAAYAASDWGAIKDAGYDGLRLTEVPGSKEVVLFDPAVAAASVTRQAPYSPLTAKNFGKWQEPTGDQIIEAIKNRK
jgi:hypothetical protein